MERVERVQRLEPREVAFNDAAWQEAMLAPLYVDRGGIAPAPVGVQHFAVPVRPEVGGCTAGVVADPHDLLVGGHGEGDPGAVNVVPPEQVITDDRACRVDDGNGALEREPFVPLQV